VGSIGSVLSVASIGCAASAASLLSAGCLWSALSFRSRDAWRSYRASSTRRSVSR
jgi:hypothetical protein